MVGPPLFRRLHRLVAGVGAPSRDWSGTHRAEGAGDSPSPVSAAEGGERVHVRVRPRPVSAGGGLRHYRVLGTVIACDLRVCDLPPAGSAAVVAIRRADGPLPRPGALVREIADEEADEPLIRVWDGVDGMTYWARGVGTFWIAPDGRDVRYTLEADACHTDVEHLIGGPVSGLALQLQGRVILHASAVVVDGAAVAFSGPHGIGKSTLAAALARAGYPLLTDDMLPLVGGPGGFLAMHSVPRLKLWRDSLEALGEDPARFGPVVSWLDKRRLTVGREWGQVWTEAVPLRAVYLLSPHHGPGREVVVSEPPPTSAAFRLLGNMYMAELLRGARAARALGVAADLAATVRVREITYHRAFAELPRLCTAILADVRAMSATG